MCHRNRIVFPLLLVLIGVYFLLRNYGALPEAFEAGKLWPVILIALGLGALLCRHRKDGCGEDKAK